jgi:hypothetical protein
VVHVADLAPLSGRQASVRWHLVGIDGAGCALRVVFSPGCHEPTTVQVKETPATVTMRVLRSRPGTALCNGIRRALVTLRTPLGNRGLRHAPVGTGAASTAQQATAPCRAAALRALGTRVGENGTARIQVDFKNVGTTPCRLAGTPGIRLQRIDQSPLSVHTVSPSSTFLAAPTILPPGVPRAATLVADWANWCAANPGQLALRITLADRDTLTVALNRPVGGPYVPRCDHPQVPSSLQLLAAYAPER